MNTPTEKTSHNRKKRVVITGATGNLGGKLRAHLAAVGSYELVLIDLVAGGAHDILPADLNDLAGGWPDLLRGADVVVHLAGEPRQLLEWRQLQTANIDTTLALFDAAARHGVQRVIYASTNMVMDGYRGTSTRITSFLPERPTSLYAASKLVGERVGRIFSDRHELSVINLRIGMIRPGTNPPPLGMDVWEQRKWLSNGDFCRAVERAIEASGVSFATLNLMSDNEGMTWDLEEAQQTIGFVPADRSTPAQPPPWKRVRLFLRRVKRRLRGQTF
jgi:nucleoside-diphosphate-sugar epimerase